MRTQIGTPARSPRVTARHKLSVQYHVEKDESNYLLSGRLLLEQGESEETMRRHVLKPGAAWRNAPNVVHTTRHWRIR